ncbi:MAG: TorF family putative porin [Paracoccaceae bacterium]
MALLQKSTVLALLLTSAHGVNAQDITYFAGVKLTSNYVSNGVTQSDDKPAVQPYLEVEVNKFYVGAWMSSVDLPENDKIELDLYVGYRQSFDSGLFVDVGYARYLYDDSGDCCGEAKLTLAYNIADRLGLIAAVAYNPDSGNFNNRFTAAYTITDKFAVAGTYGKNDGYQNNYWDVGATYAINDNVKLDARYYGATSGDEGLAVSLIFGSANESFGRLFTEPFGN